MKIDIDELSVKELIDLNRRIVERLKFLESMRAHAEMLEFSVGDQVQFNAPGRGAISGILIKYNRKTVTVLTTDGHKWNVSPYLLQKAASPAADTKKAGNVIEIRPK